SESMTAERAKETELKISDNKATTQTGPHFFILCQLCMSRNVPALILCVNRDFLFDFPIPSLSIARNGFPVQCFSRSGSAVFPVVAEVAGFASGGFLTAEDAVFPIDFVDTSPCFPGAPRAPRGARLARRSGAAARGYRRRGNDRCDRLRAQLRRH